MLAVHRPPLILALLTSTAVAMMFGCGGNSSNSSGQGAGGSSSVASGGAMSGPTGTGGAGAAGGGGGATVLTSEHCPTPMSGHPAGTRLYVGGGGTEGRTAVSLDGAQWVDLTTTSYGTMEPGHSRNLIRGAGYGGGLFVMVGGHDNSYISTSCDGVNWRQDVLGTNIDGPVPSEYNSFLSDVAYKDGVFVAAGGAGIRLTSLDHGLSWQATGDYVNGHFRGIAVGNGVFVATGHDWGDGNGLVSVSSDGESWSDVAVSAGELGAVAFGNGVFVSIGVARCATSSDGVSWNDCNTGVNVGHLGLHFINGQFFLQFQNGVFKTSQNGITWSDPVDGWLPDTIAEAAGLFVMSRWGARGFSSDMMNWTETAFPTEWGLSRVVVGEVLYQPQ